MPGAGGGRGRELLRALGLARSLPAGGSGAGRPEVPPSARPRPPEPLSQGAPCQLPVGKKKQQQQQTRGRGLIAPSCLQPCQFRGRGQDPNRLAGSAGGMCEIISSTQLKIPRLPKSRATSLPLPGERVPCGAMRAVRSAPLCLEPVAARSEWICRFISPVQNPRVFSHPLGGKPQAPIPQALPLQPPGMFLPRNRGCLGAHALNLIPLPVLLLHPPGMPGNIYLLATFLFRCFSASCEGFFFFFFYLFSFSFSQEFANSEGYVC